MMAAMASFHFLRPAWLLALLPLALILWRGWRRHRAVNPWPQWVDAPLLRTLLIPAAGRAERLPWLLLALFWTLAALALAGPSWRQAPTPLYRPAAPPLVVLLDLSRHMQATDIKPSRLQAAKARLRSLLERLPPRRLALVAFGPEAYPVMPLTRDRRLVVSLLESLDSDLLPAPGHNPADAIHAGLAMIHRSGETHGDLLMITARADAAAIDAASKVKGTGQRLSVYAIVPGAARSDDDRDTAKLKDMALAGGGRFIAYRRTTDDITALLEGIARPTDRMATQAAHRSPQWRDDGAWLLLFALPLAALLFRRNGLLILPLALLIQPADSEAVEWRDLWLNQDQRALALLREGEAARAARLFRDPLWRGIALYRAGDYATAAKAFGGVDTAIGHYNRGNALAHQGRLPEALAAYRKALALKPGFREAEENRQRIQQRLATPLKKPAPPSPRKNRKTRGQAPSGKKRPTPPQKSQPPAAPRPLVDAPRPGSTRDQRKGHAGGLQAPPHPSEGKTGKGRQPPANTPPSHHEKRPAGSKTRPLSGSRPPPPSRRDTPTDIPKKMPLGSKTSPSTGRQQLDSRRKPVTPHTGRPTPQRSSGQNGEVGRNSLKDAERREAIEHWLARIPEDPRPFLRELFRRRHLRAQKGALW